MPKASDDSVAIYGPAGERLNVSKRAFELLYAEKGFTLAQPDGEENVESLRLCLDEANRVVSAQAAQLADALAELRQLRANAPLQELEANRARLADTEAQLSAANAELEQLRTAAAPTDTGETGDIPPETPEPSAPSGPVDHVDVVTHGDPDTVKTWLADTPIKDVLATLDEAENRAAGSRTHLASALLGFEQERGEDARTTLIDRLEAVVAPEKEKKAHE